MASYGGSVTVFSPDGHLLQVKYAQETARQGFPVVGILGEDVIVLAAERRVVSKLQMERTEKKIVQLDGHVLLAFSGWKSDARVIISRARIECQSHRLIAEDPVTTEYITRYIAEMKQQYTQSNGRRPFGVSCVVAGFDTDGTPHLFQTEPSGNYYEWKACSTGRNGKTTMEFLEKNYSPEAVATEAGIIRLAIRALLEVLHSGQRNIDVAVLKRGQPVRLLEQGEVDTVASEIESDTK